jgi:hypothetical protein
MNKMLATQLDEALCRPAERTRLDFKSPLRVGATTLISSDGEITATTVLGVVGADDIQPFKKVVADIADEFELDARIYFGVGSFSVRFTRQHP